MPATLAPMLAEIGDAPVQSRGLDVGAQARRLSRARLHRRARRQAALAARPRARRASFRGSRRSSRQQAVSGMILDGELVAFDAERQAVVRRAAGTRAAEDGARDRGRRRDDARGLLLLRSAALRGHRSAHARLTAIGAAISPNACCRRRSCSSCTRRDDGDRVAAPRRSRAASRAWSASARKAVTRPAGARRRGSRSSRRTSADFVVGGYTKGKGARAPLGALLVGYWDKKAAALRVARRLGLRRAHAGASQGALGAAATQDLSLRRDAGAQCADDVGRARRSSPR